MSGQNLILIPGLVCDAQVWRHQTDHLADIANISVPAVDQSDKMTDMAAGVLADAPTKFALAGFSMGGYVALEMLRQAPDRISRLALLDTSARPDTEEKARGRIETIKVCEDGKFDDVIQGMLKILLYPNHQREPLSKFVPAMAARVGSKAFVNRHRSILTRQDNRDILKAADIPVRAICGRQDAMSSVEEHEEIAELGPRGRLSIIEDCGHMAILERPQAATALLRDWLLYD